MRQTRWLAAMAVFVSSWAVSAQEYAIKVKRPGLGDQVLVKIGSTTSMEFKLLDSNGNAVVNKKEVKGGKFAFRETGLERAAFGEELVRLQRDYDTAERSNDGNQEKLPYQGKTVLIEKKDGKFGFQIKGGSTVEGEDAKELHEEFIKGDIRKLLDLFLPRKTLKAGDTWTFDVSLIVKEFSKDGKVEFDAAKSKGYGKLVKVYQKGGKQFGLMDMTVEMPVTSITNDGNKTPTKDSKIVLKFERDGCIDGTLDQSHLKMILNGDIRADINANGMDFVLGITVRANVMEQRTPLSK